MRFVSLLTESDISLLFKNGVPFICSYDGSDLFFDVVRQLPQTTQSETRGRSSSAMLIFLVQSKKYRSYFVIALGMSRL